MLLRSLLEAVPDALISGSVEIEIRDIVYDSRRVVPSSLFAAVPSVGGDAASGGNRHIPEAIARGAAAVVVGDGHALPGVTTIQVPDVRRALGDLSAAFFGHPSRQLRLYGVTGTDGKSTTTYFLEQIFAGAGYRTGLIGTIEVKIGGVRRANRERMTTPESPDLQRQLREMVEAGVTHAAMEVSSHGIALERVRGCSFAACALTNITADHIEFHGSWEAYFEAKARLFTDLARGRPAILNHEDEHFARLVERVPGPVMTYGLGPQADLYADEIAPGDDCSTCVLRAGEAWAPCTVPLPGTYNISNALAATGLALSDGLSLQSAADALRRAEPPPGRLERVDVGQPFRVLVDYAHTMHGFRSVLAELRDRTPPPHRLIAVFGATGDRDRAKRPVLARVAREYSDFFIITNEDPYGEQAEAIIAEVASGAPQAEEGIRYECEHDRARAIEKAIVRAKDGDTVVILGKGHEQNMVVGGQKRSWSDVAAARQALEQAR